MYLKALEIQGFKSFPDKTVLSFGEDITAIVGPNGSGKSNISDAIRWVMGEQSSKALRGGKMEDVIFGGTPKRKQMGYAEVSLILDNSEHIFQREESEIMITRRYYRSGESEYFINKASCRLRDVNELFMDTGLGREGYSIIGQGKVDAILSVKSSDRREIFEEAAGISRFRHRKEEAERKLAHTSDNLVRISDKIEELEMQVEPLRIQAEKAKKYLLCRDELRGLEISVWLEQLDRLREDSRKLLSDYDAACSDRDAAKAAQEALFAEVEVLGEQMQEIERETEVIRTEIGGMDAQISEMEAKIAVLKNDIQNNLENSERIVQEMNQQGDRAQSVADQIAEQQERLNELVRLRAQKEAELAKKLEEAEDAQRSAGTLADEMEALRQRVEIQYADAGDARALLSALTAAQQELMDRDATLRASIQETRDRLEKTESEAKAKHRELTDAAEERDAVSNMIAGYTMRLESRKKRSSEAANLEVNLTMQENALSSRIHMLAEMEKMYEGYSKSVKTIMQAAERGQLSGVHGPVAGLIKVPDTYAVAIEIALGGAMQNIVVSRQADGKAGMNYLKRRDGGRATFLPMDVIRPNSIQERDLDDQYGFVGIASQLISFEPQYQNVFDNLLGRVIIAEDIDSAIAISRTYRQRYRIVTLDGQVLNAGGSMTGGSVSKSAGILSRSNELERLNEQIGGLRAELEEAKKKAAEAKRELQQAEYELEVALNQKHEADAKVLKLQGEYGQYEILLDGLRRGLESYRGELEELSSRLKRTEDETDAAVARIAELEGEAEALRHESEGKASGERIIRERADAIASEIASIRMDIAGYDAEEGAVTGAMTQLKELQSSLVTDQDARRNLIEAYNQKDAELKKQIREKEQELQSLRMKRGTLEDRVRRMIQKRMELEGKRTQVSKDARAKNEEMLSLERDVAHLDQKKVQAEMLEKQLLDKLWDTYELSHSEALKQRQELESMQKAQRRIQELKRTINGLGAVNVGAVEEYERVNERYTYLSTQREDVEKAKQDLESIIATITEQMKEIFATQFELIAQSFSQTFTELFRGGKASLELEDKEDILNCGIEIKVQPPGKSLKIISLLSGGEKAFVAIALYFAILKVRPTPFVVMDEIEAALDDANVTRFARYMRQLTGHTQFITITHRRGTMEEADILYGVTMQDQGISRMLTINLNDVERELHIK